ncbi:hypothetical protein AVU12_gp045 [Pseudomonas phage KPP21]|uniref:Uncharacterized protein n=1 Tax=Pseudomonas phage KPP21 TaxID=1678082 RepID=A0A0H5BI72_BPK21|nr:hypothetical protein AVU12_gp045 [Pseudomonas phage KPP21]BAR94604.1 hypothetical protein [Pseudomonas phage KPP21]
MGIVMEYQVYIVLNVRVWKDVGVGTLREMMQLYAVHSHSNLSPFSLLAISADSRRGKGYFLQPTVQREKRETQRSIRKKGVDVCS